jgi:hypothetical protein
VKDAQIVYDTNMNTLSSAVKKIEQALDAGRRVRILYTLRDPTEAFTQGMLGRATRMEKQQGSGRTVPIDEHAKTHAGSAKVIKQLAERYRDDPRVQVDVIDNRHGPGNARAMAVEDVPDFDYNQLRETLSPILEAERAAGRVSERVYAGVKGNDGRGVSGVEPPTPGGRDQGSERSDQADPVTDALLASLDENLEIPTGASDADGRLVMARAADLLAEYEAELARAELEGQGVLAAVNCFIQQGA